MISPVGNIIALIHYLIKAKRQERAHHSSVIFTNFSNEKRSLFVKEQNKRAETPKVIILPFYLFFILRLPFLRMVMLSLQTPSTRKRLNIERYDHALCSMLKC